MLREVVDQAFGDRGPVAGKGHRQVHHQRVARVGVHRQPEGPADGGQVKRDGRLSRRDAVVVCRGEGLRDLAQRAGLDRAGQFHRGGQVGQQDHLPCSAALAGDGQPAALRHREPLRGVSGAGRFTGAAADRLVHDQRAGVAIQAQGDLAARHHLDPARRQVGQIEGGQPGPGRRRDPAFPGGAGGDLCRLTDRLGHLPDTPVAAEQQRDGQHQHRHVAQADRGRATRCAGRAGVARASRVRRAIRARCAAQTARLAGSASPITCRSLTAAMGRPGRVASSRASACARVGQRSRIRPKPSATSPPKRRQHDPGPDRLDRQAVLPAHQERRHGDKQHRPDRPERAGQPFGQHPGQRQPDRPAQVRQNVGRFTRDAVQRTGVHSHAGMVSRESISSKVGLRRITA